MVNLDIQWSDPYQWENNCGEFMWRRFWKIPIDYRSSFFAFWNGAKYNLWKEGFSISKIDTDWYLYETKVCAENFASFEGQKPPTLPPEAEEFWLPPYKVENESGLRIWQIDSVSKLVGAINKGNCAIDGSDLGVGKTYVAVAVARELKMKILVVCPMAVMEPWRRVIENHFKMKKDLIGIINYEQIRIGKSDSPFASYIENRKTHKRSFVWKIPKNTLIVWDESQKLKNWKTKNSKTCIEALKQNYKMLFCSATNATNPLELRTVGTCLKLFIKGATNYYQWCYEHGVFKGRFGLEFTTDIKLRKKVLQKLHTDIFINRGVRQTRDAIPNFPESEIIAECYNMDDVDVKRINECHAEMQKELKELVKSSKTDKVNELTIILREREKTELIKVPLFIDMIEEGFEDGMSVVVFINFTATLNALAKRLNTNCIFDGKNSKTRQQNVDDFQNDIERVILVNIQSGGAGLTLGDMTGKYPRLSLISPAYSAVLMRQATGRVWRESSKTKSIQKIVFVAGTVEERVCDIVKDKLSNLDMLNDGDLSYVDNKF